MLICNQTWYFVGLLEQLEKQNKTKQNKTKQNKTKQKQNKTKGTVLYMIFCWFVGAIRKTKQNKTKTKTKQNKNKQNEKKYDAIHDILLICRGRSQLKFKYYRWKVMLSFGVEN